MAEPISTTTLFTIAAIAAVTAASAAGVAAQRQAVAINRAAKEAERNAERAAAFRNAQAKADNALSLRKSYQKYEVARGRMRVSTAEAGLAGLGVDPSNLLTSASNLEQEAQGLQIQSNLSTTFLQLEDALANIGANTRATGADALFATASAGMSGFSSGVNLASNISANQAAQPPE